VAFDPGLFPDLSCKPPADFASIPPAKEPGKYVCFAREVVEFP